MKMAADSLIGQLEAVAEPEELIAAEQTGYYRLADMTAVGYYHKSAAVVMTAADRMAVVVAPEGGQPEADKQLELLEGPVEPPLEAVVRTDELPP